jgi:hypothetical protein
MCFLNPGRLFTLRIGKRHTAAAERMELSGLMMLLLISGPRGTACQVIPVPCRKRPGRAGLGWLFLLEVCVLRKRHT